MPMKPLAGLLLSLSCLLGVAATGSVFELAYGDPRLGVVPTAVILAVSAPGTVLTLLMAMAWNGRPS
ncbi:MAG: hypothetical protein TQ37_06050 [Candidatus Synechococcus spongiarum 15L]|uniref:Uncharacterized protein n=3 Tax=Candidatus Synechococcus spongiarum TaxID=431041 RepID=A0A1T1D486_9SYNE|nr:hypothetical protein [Candidatus Synechococcus spongiarum]KKZ12105.1 MAG: hypothetical protein TQ37_06050 [Candidatus Synechococcus spongiarum 15L]MCY4359497.1 hypothetical protein [Cyanobacteria bacterium MAG APA_bin_95]OOV35675.1 hypothetical protein BV61_00060 [Candidatus Synechococcus spongiarum LMB bulk15M]OOV35739.1 hypothetical protein BV53_03075 [Candidatus Synechococcus spongiarum LMB bulk15N]